MAVVKPFKGWRYTKSAGDISELVCPPYDIISEEERVALLARNPRNMVRLELPREGDDPYAGAAVTLSRFMEEGVVQADASPAFYVYDMAFSFDGEEKRLSGLMARVGLAEFSEGVVLPHENTLSKAKEDRLRLMKATGFNFSCIYSLYMDGDPAPVEQAMADAMAAPPLSDVTDGDGVRHRLWAITNTEVCAALTKRFENTRLFIADGHHRYETALNYRRYLRETGKPAGDADAVMMWLCDMRHPGLVVCPTHRMVRDLPGFDAEALLSRCEEYFEVERALPLAQGQRRLADAFEQGRTAFLFAAGGDTVSVLTLRDPAVMDAFLPELSPVSRRLDVNVLHTLVLERLFGIDKENMANQKNLVYTKIEREALAQAGTAQVQCSFLLNPTRVTELRDVAAAGEKMPQKSTYFYPKPITGLVMNDLQNR